LDKYEIVVDKVTAEKPKATVIIDDRALTFDGHPETLLGKINGFKPWNR
jgi:Mg-chelatase subunit ChlI